jgi:tRNA C32,U32 (ribose-2'-O)-methylase TrmJ
LGFSDLRLVGVTGLPASAFRTAVHAGTVLDGARFAATLGEAVSDRHLVLASTARARGPAGLVTLGGAVDRLSAYPPGTRVALVFGNERTGLSAAELGLANIRFRISQAARQPSYNLGVAVTLTLFALATSAGEPPPPVRERPLVQAEQDDAVRRFRDLLDGLGFMKETNRAYISRRVEDIFRRMTLTAKDRDIILAMFRRAIAGGTGRRSGGAGRPGPTMTHKGESHGQ